MAKKDQTSETSINEDSIVEKQFVTFKINEEEFGIDIDLVLKIKKMEEYTIIPNSLSYVKGIMNLRGKIIVIMDLANKLGLPTGEITPDTRIIVVTINNNTIGLIVDNAQELLRISSDKIDNAPKILSDKINEDYIKGVAILGERLILLLNLERLIESDIKAIEAMSKQASGL